MFSNGTNFDLTTLLEEKILEKMTISICKLTGIIQELLIATPL